MGVTVTADVLSKTRKCFSIRPGHNDLEIDIPYIMKLIGNTVSLAQSDFTRRTWLAFEQGFNKPLAERMVALDGHAIAYSIAR